jgi:hypothetical protein
MPAPERPSTVVTPISGTVWLTSDPVFINDPTEKVQHQWAWIKEVVEKADRHADPKHAKFAAWKIFKLGHNEPVGLAFYERGGAIFASFGDPNDPNLGILKAHLSKQAAVRLKNLVALRHW